MPERRLETDTSTDGVDCLNPETGTSADQRCESDIEDAFLSPKLAAASRDTEIIDRSTVDGLADPFQLTTDWTN